MYDAVSGVEGPGAEGICSDIEVIQQDTIVVTMWGVRVLCALFTFVISTVLAVRDGTIVW